MFRKIAKVVNTDKYFTDKDKAIIKAMAQASMSEEDIRNSFEMVKNSKDQLKTSQEISESLKKQAAYINGLMSKLSPKAQAFFLGVMKEDIDKFTQGLKVKKYGK
jgi:hypothetical protein